MVEDVRSILSAVIPDPPEDLLSHFSSDDLPRVPDLCINILPLADAVNYTLAVQDLDIGESFGLVTLEDANNSNPHCYITKGILRGHILHLTHDDDIHVSYRSLDRFMSEIKAAVRDRRWIEDLQDDRPFLAKGQEALAARIWTFLNDDGSVPLDEVLVLISLLDTSHVDIVKSLASYPDFYVREAAAQQIAAWPNVELRAVAEALAEDQYPQVARPGRQAEFAIRRMRFGTE